jgi:hypothetical protein
MTLTLTMLGLIFTAIGALILMLNNLFTGWHQRVYGQSLNKRYWWMGWRPFLKITHPDGKIERKVKLDHKVIVEGFIPPKYFWEIIGFLCILIGTILQIIAIQ